jgi:hypothetical protein
MNRLPSEALHGYFSNEAFIADYPAIPEELLARFEKDYPPECWNPALVPEYQHMKYAGIVEFIKWLRGIKNGKDTVAFGLDPDAKHVTQEGGA